MPRAECLLSVPQASFFIILGPELNKRRDYVSASSKQQRRIKYLRTPYHQHDQLKATSVIKLCGASAAKEERTCGKIFRVDEVEVGLRQ